MLSTSVGSFNSPESTPSLNSVECSNKRARVEFSEDDIIDDPALCKPIEDYAIEIRDEVRRRYLAKGPCQPFGLNFPPRIFGKNTRCFIAGWFSKYEWLEYSVSKDAAFCFLCYLFGKEVKCSGEAFTKRGFTNWKNATEKFKNHVGGVHSPHNKARMQFLRFHNQMPNGSHIVSSHGLSTYAASCRIRLTAVVDVIKFLLEQGMNFGGNDKSSESFRKGNFLALLDWYSVHNEEVRNAIVNAPENDQTTSPEIQKQIVSACSVETRKAILDDIGDKCFSLLIDEALYCSVKEQMAIVLRYVNSHGEVVERFIGILQVPDASALSLKSAIDDFFAKNGLSLSRLRGQSYNGASNMRDELNGLKELILNENPHAKYIHCFAHRLLLVVVAVAGAISDVSDCFNYVSKIVNLVGASCNMRDDLKQKQHDYLFEQLEKDEISAGKGVNQETSLTRPDDTRWGSYYQTLFWLLSLWSQVIKVLENILVDGEQNNRGIALTLMEKMETYKFVFIAHFMRELLGIINDLSELLQQRYQNIGDNIIMIKTVKDRLKEWRNLGWDDLLEGVNQFCVKHNIPIPNIEENMPGRSSLRRKGQYVTYLHHFRVNIFCQVIDLVSQEMDNRFTESASELLSCVACLDPSNSFANFDHSKLLRMAELYSKDFSIVDQMELKQQLKNYIHEFKSNNHFSNLCDIGGMVKKMVEINYHTVFHLVFKLLELALILPVATANVERDLSAMSIIETDVHDKMGEDFLTDCLICYIELEIFKNIETETIIQRLESMQTPKEGK